MRWNVRLRRLAREPLLHFALIGLLLFIAYGWRNPVDDDSRTITVTAPRVEALAATWAQAWQRPPTPAEIDRLIREDIKDEVYYREAVRLGLTRDDEVVRKRMRNRMEFLASANAEAQVPTDADLQALLDREPARYQLAPRLTFDQIYLGGSPAAAAEVRRQLAAGADPALLGEHGTLPATLSAADADTVQSSFGEGFAAAVAALPPGNNWAGPIESGLGWHLVRLHARLPAETPRLADVRQRVENDWRAAKRRDAEAAAYQALLDGYTIRIEKPEA